MRTRFHTSSRLEGETTGISEMAYSRLETILHNSKGCVDREANLDCNDVLSLPLRTRRIWRAVVTLMLRPSKSPKISSSFTILVNAPKLSP